MMNCHRATRLMSESQERELTRGERISLFFHKAICSACRRFGKQMGTLRRISRTYANGGESPDDKDKNG